MVDTCQSVARLSVCSLNWTGSRPGSLVDSRVSKG